MKNRGEDWDCCVEIPVENNTDAINACAIFDCGTAAGMRHGRTRVLPKGTRS
jgi:hypothetical protein